MFISRGTLRSPARVRVNGAITTRLRLCTVIDCLLRFSAFSWIRTGCLREDVAYVTPHHGATGVFGLSRCDKPRRARNIAHLVDQLESTILRVFPKGNDPISGWFLNGPVGRVGRARP